jgi:hypothetical protein
MTSLAPGLGAVATVLTKEIKPFSEGRLPNDLQALVTKSASAAIRTIEWSKIILTDFVKVDKSIYYKFYLHADNESGNEDATILLASRHYFKLTKEGDQSLFFVGDPKTIATKKKKSKSGEKLEEPEIAWRDSKAKKLLYKALMRGKIPAKTRDQQNKSTMELYMLCVHNIMNIVTICSQVDWAASDQLFPQTHKELKMIRLHSMYT